MRGKSFGTVASPILALGRASGGGDVPVGAAIYAASDPGAKFARCDGSFKALTDPQIAALGLEPQIQTMGAPVPNNMSTGYAAYFGAYGNGTYVFTAGDGSGTGGRYVNVSIDNGSSFGLFDVTGGSSYYYYGLVFAGGLFYLLMNGGFYTSANGKVWSSLAMPNGLGLPSAIGEGNGCCVLYFGSSPRRIYTHDTVNGFVQKAMPTDTTDMVGAIRYSIELGLYIISFKKSDGLNYAHTSPDLITYRNLGYYPLAGYTYVFGLLGAVNGASIEYRNPNTFAGAGQFATGIGQIYDMRMVNGLLIVIGDRGVLELREPFSGASALFDNSGNSGLGSIATNGRGYVAARAGGSVNVYVNSPKAPNGLWMPSMASRRNAKSQSVDAYMRIAA